jgi:hypothetical protein
MTGITEQNVLDTLESFGNATCLIKINGGCCGIEGSALEQDSTSAMDG